jgi:hypothetical protein
MVLLLPLPSIPLQITYPWLSLGVVHQQFLCSNLQRGHLIMVTATVWNKGEGILNPFGVTCGSIKLNNHTLFKNILNLPIVFVCMDR